MTFNRIQMLRNKQIKIARDRKDSYMYIQGPTIGQVYEDEKLFLVAQIIMMPEKELINFLNLQDSKLNKLELLTLLLTQFQEKEMFLEKFQKIILDLYVKNEKLFVGAQLLKLKELQKIEEVLQIIMGQKISTSKDEEELSPEEKRMLELEEKIKAKKQKQEEEEGKTEQDANTIEDIMIAVIYEFGFDLEKIMNMNYFTLIWFYSYTSKLHVYRINQFAIGSGMVKKINSDYFTSLK